MLPKKSNKLMRVIILVFIMILSFSFKEQNPVRKFNSFYFVYVENAKIPGKEALTLAQKARISQCVKSVKNIKDVRFLLYIANGEKPEIVDDPNKAEESIENLYSKQYKSSQFVDDKRNIRKILEDKPFGVKDTISINYILSENYMSNFVLGKETGDLLNLFPRELAYLLNVSSNEVIVNIFYSNSSKLIDEKSIKRAIDFYNKDTFKLLNYKLIKL
jgi:hypothetical protein